MDDLKIIELYWSRDEAALEHTEKKYHAPCFALANNILRDSYESEECVNDTWLKAWNSIPPSRPDVLKAFLLKITRNTAIGFLRRRSSLKRGGADAVIYELDECVPSRSDTERDMELNELTDAINGFLSRLSERDRGIFVKRYFYCATVKETASFFGLPENTVKSVLLRSRSKLKAHLEKEGLTP